jgi:hypothetical protein
MGTTQFARERRVIDDGVAKVQLPQVIFANDICNELGAGVQGSVRISTRIARVPNHAVMRLFRVYKENPVRSNLMPGTSVTKGY